MQFTNKVVLAAVVGFSVPALVAVFVASSHQEKHEIPAAVAAEANMVCTPFQGLRAFSATQQGKAANEVTTLTEYKVVAFCKSSHEVSSTIALDLTIPTKD